MTDKPTHPFTSVKQRNSFTLEGNIDHSVSRGQHAKCMYGFCLIKNSFIMHIDVFTELKKWR